MSPSIQGMFGSLWKKQCKMWSVVIICNNARKKNDACQNNHNEGSKSVSAKRLHLRPMWAEGTLNRSMTGILIYSVRSLFSHSPLSQANVKPFHSKPTPVTSKLKHDIMHYPRLPRVLHYTPDTGRTPRLEPWQPVLFFFSRLQDGARNATVTKINNLPWSEKQMPSPEPQSLHSA